MLNVVLQRMIAELCEDIASGLVPSTVSSFAELHDYVDANCYGGFCDDDADFEFEFTVRCQNALDRLIKIGAFHE